MVLNILFKQFKSNEFIKNYRMLDLSVSMSINSLKNLNYRSLTKINGEIVKDFGIRSRRFYTKYTEVAKPSLVWKVN